MANQPEINNFDAGVYQLETTDPVQGGVGGVSNSPLLNLANRTRWLYNQITSILTTIAGLATLNSPALTGTPSAPTPAAGDSSTKLATTQFAANASAIAAVNVAGNSNVVLTAAQYGLGVIALSGALTGSINVVFPVNGKWIVVNNTTGAFTITCKTAGGGGIVVTQGKARALFGDGTNIADDRSDFASVALTGTPTAPTAGAGDNSATIATTAFVKSQGYATLASPAFTGAPSAPTAPGSDDTTKIANTAWVWSNIQALVQSCIGAAATAMGFVISIGISGYIKLPSWLGGFMVQWSHTTASDGDNVSFPTAFPTAGLSVCCTPASNTTLTIGFNVELVTATYFTVHPNQAGSGTTCGFWFIAIGY